MDRIVDQDGREYLSNTVDTAIGKVKLEVEVTNVDPTTIKKVSICMAEAEPFPFGLSCEDSVIIFMPHELTAVWYSRGSYQKTILELPNLVAFVACLTQYLQTHPYFMGPVMALRFAESVKIILDERERELSEQHPDPALPEPVKPAGPLEASKG